MKKIFLIFVLMVTSISYAQIETIQNQAEIKANQLNSNFETIRSQLNQANLDKGYSQLDIDAIGSLITLRPVDINDTQKDVIRAADLNANFNFLKLLAENAQNWDVCSSDNAGLFGYDMTNVDSISGQGPDACSLSCSTGYILSGDSLSCQAQLCETNQDLTDNLGITDFTGVNTISGDYVSGCSYTCDSAYTEASGQPYACEVIQCSLAELGDIDNTNGAVLSVSGDLATDCSVDSCALGYSIAGDANSCIIDNYACQEQDVIDNGGDTSNALTFTGNVIGVDKSSCLIETCNTNYSLAGDSLSCSPTQCTTIADLSSDNPAITETLGIDSISGDLVNGCDYTCSSPGYFKVANGCLSNQCTLADAQSNGATIDNASSATGIKSSAGDFSSCLIGTCNTDYYVINSGLDCSVSALDVGLTFDSSVNFFNETPDTVYSTSDLNTVYSDYVSSGEDISQSGSGADTWRNNLLNAESRENTSVESAPLNAKWKAMWYKIQELKSRVDTLENP